MGGEDEGTDAVRVKVDEGEGLLHLGSAFQNVCLHYVAIFYLLSLLLCSLCIVHLQSSAFLFHLRLLFGLSLLFHFIVPLNRLLPLILILHFRVNGSEVMIESMHQFV